MNTNISINNIQNVVNSAEQLAALTTDLESARDSVEYILNEVKEFWSQTQQDAQTFSEGLTQNLESLKTMSECNKEFAQAITNYAESTNTTSQNVI